MPRTTIDTWNPHFLDSAPLFEALRPVAEYFCDDDWPNLLAMQQQFVQRGLPISIVPQGGKPECREEKYESRIFLQGELQTREQNWHDFFNALVWLAFPKTKFILNALNYHASLQRAEKTNRSPVENAIAGFDESGAIVVSRRPDLLQMIRDHEWQRLFVENREAFGVDIHCVIFGHALYEKAMSPYIGMTAQTVLIGDADCQDLDLSSLDNRVADYWQQGKVQNPKDMASLPILGVPGWYPQQDAEFYGDQRYFRPKPVRKVDSSSG